MLSIETDYLSNFLSGLNMEESANENINYSQLNDKEKISFLRKYWNIGVNKPFEFIGKVTSSKSGIYTVEKVVKPDGSPVEYPDCDSRFSLFLGNASDRLKEKHISDDDYVSVKIENIKFASIEEQKKKGSAFVLSWIPPSFLTKLHHIPKQYFPAFLKNMGDEGFLEEWVIKEKSDEIKEIEKKTEQLKKKYEEEHLLVEVGIKQKYAKLEQDAENKINEIQKQAEKETNKLNRIKTNHEKEKTELTDLITQKEAAQDELNKANSLIEESTARFKNQIEQIKQRILLLSNLGIIDHKTAESFLDVKIDSKINLPFNGDYNNVVDYIQAKMFSSGSYYKKSLVRNFCALLNTHDLILFAGDSGLGKTNLVKRFAEACGGVAKIIPVKPNWTSSDDLIGYYNPLEKRYISTPFLDAIFEAKENPDRLYLICLDEMNLARIEYYFADFLSKLEERKSNTEIELYSENEDGLVADECQELLSELADNEKIKSYLQGNDNERILLNENLEKILQENNEQELLKKIQSLKLSERQRIRCQSSFTLPNNVRFIGTLNVDDTTYYLSPKILDRVHIIRFENPLFINMENIEKEINTDLLNSSIHINPLTFFDEKSAYPNFLSRKDEKLVKKLITLSNMIESLGISFGPRVVNQALLYSDSMKKFNEDDEGVIFNNFVLQKIFPRFLFDGSDSISDGSSRTKLDILNEVSVFIRNSLSNSTSSEITCIAELNKVITKAQQGNLQVNYWIK